MPLAVTSSPNQPQELIELQKLNHAQKLIQPKERWQIAGTVFDLTCSDNKLSSSWSEVRTHFFSGLAQIIKGLKTRYRFKDANIIRNVTQVNSINASQYDNSTTAKPATPDQLQYTIDNATDYLKDTQRQDGSWSSTYAGGPMHTCLRTIALSKLNVHDSTETTKAIIFNILDFQLENGGFVLYTSGSPSKSITRLCYLTLVLLMNSNNGVLYQDAELRNIVENALVKAKGFIASKAKSQELAGYTMTTDFCWDLSAPAITHSIPPIPFASLVGFVSLSIGLFNIFQMNLLKVLPSFFILHQLRINRNYVGRMFSRLEDPVLRKFEARIVDTQDGNGSWLYLVFVTSLNLLALHSRGHDMDSPVIRKGVKYLVDSASITSQGKLKLNFMNGELWDTVTHAGVLNLSGTQTSAQIIKSILPHLLDGVREDNRWAFSISGRTTDNDSSAVALAIIAHLYNDMDTFQKQLSAPQIRKTCRAILAHQQKDGGWAGFDDSAPIRFGSQAPGPTEAVLFDSSTPDITGRVMAGLLATYEMDVIPYSLKVQIEMALSKAVSYFSTAQCRSGLAEGSYWSRWIAGPISGTCFATIALRAAGVDPEDKKLSLARDFLLNTQDSFIGGWGESPESDIDPQAVGQGPCTPLQTALAISGLIACADNDDHLAATAIHKGVNYLISHEKNGQWDDQTPLATFHTGIEYYCTPENTNIAVVTALLLYKRYIQSGPEDAIHYIVKH